MDASDEYTVRFATAQRRYLIDLVAALVNLGVQPDRAAQAAIHGANTITPHLVTDEAIQAFTELLARRPVHAPGNDRTATTQREDGGGPAQCSPAGAVTRNPLGGS